MSPPAAPNGGPSGGPAWEEVRVRIRLRGRLFLALAGLLMVLLVAAWILTTGAVLGPLLRELQGERVEVALYIARELERAEDPRDRARALSAELGVRIDPPRRLPHDLPPGARLREAGGRTVALMPGPRAPIAVEVRGHHREGWLLVHFPADLEAPPRRVGLVLALLLVGAVVLAWMVIDRALRPLRVATAAMERIAGGDLRHRVSEQGPLAEVGLTFNHMAERVQGIVRGQQQWMAAVSHELRTPLARMRLSLTLSREDESASPADRVRRIDALEADLAEMQSLIDDLLESARLEQGLLALRPESVEARELVLDALSAVDLGEREIELQVPEALPLWVDRQQLRRALMNLLTNIGRYTPAQARVQISLRADGADLVLQVDDDGPGVAPEHLERLFLPFYRVEASRSRGTGGLGLGLMLVRQVAAAHGGAAGARASPLGGLQVWLRLPLRAPPPAAVRAAP